MKKKIVKEFLEGQKSLRIMVLGDLILDEYIWGNINRISPEAPVPVLESVSENATLGGAANVANNLVGLNCSVSLFGVIGDDSKGRIFRGILKKRGISHSGVLVDPSRPTTNKIRVIARNQQILRVDRENRSEISEEIYRKLVSLVLDSISGVDGIICSDYGKGVLSDELIRQVVSEARKHKKKIIGDPKGADYKKYRGFSVLTPNRNEASIAAGIDLRSFEDYENSADRILGFFSGEALLITRGAEGMTLFSRNKEPVNVPTVAKEVFDVTGAGDTVISVFSTALFYGVEIGDAVRLSNVAAGIEVGKVGTSVVTLKEISEYYDSSSFEQSGKVIDMFELDQIVSRARNNGKAIVFTNGCFDLMHIGHLHYLKKAKSFGDILIIGLNSDSSVRKLKGPKRPLINEHERSSLLAALDCVDYVVIFSEKTPEGLIRKVRPDVLVKGGDYSLDQVVGKDIVLADGGAVELVPVVKRRSTTGLVEKIVATYRKQDF